MDQKILNEIYFRKVGQSPWEIDVYLDTTQGVFQVCFSDVAEVNRSVLNDCEVFAELRYLGQPGQEFVVTDIRRSYDCDLWILLSDSVFVAVQVVPSTYDELGELTVRTIEERHEPSFHEPREDFLEMNVLVWSGV